MNEVTNKHPHYNAQMEDWQTSRDFVAGSKAVKHAGAKYLPQLSGQDLKEYESYKKRALFYNAVGRTIQGLMGAIYRKPAIVEPPFEYVEKKAMEVTREVFSVGRVGVLVDLPKDGGDPYMVIYKCEQVINWAYIKQGDVKTLSQVVLEEPYSEYDKVAFKHTDKKRYRVLELEFPVTDGSEDQDDLGEPRYVQIVYEQVEKTTLGTTTQTPQVEWIEKSRVYPEMLGAWMDFIPFKFFNAVDDDPDPQRPPMMDLIEVNISHYHSSADLEHGRHFTALPTAWVAGFDAQTSLKIGSATAWVTENVSAKAGFLEFTGQGLRALETALESKERLMAILGARLFESSKDGVEAAESIRLRQSADTATASHVARIVSSGIQTCYQWMLDFSLATQGSEAFVSINTDLLDTAMSAQDMSALVTAWQSGAISMETLLWNLKQGEILPPEREFDEEVTLIEQDALRVRKFSEQFEADEEETPKGFDFEYDGTGNVTGVIPKKGTV